MCIICTGLKNQTLTTWEAATNLIEMGDSIEKEHFEELSKEISERLWLERVNICIFCAKTPCACIPGD